VDVHVDNPGTRGAASSLNFWSWVEVRGTDMLLNADTGDSLNRALIVVLIHEVGAERVARGIWQVCSAESCVADVCRGVVHLAPMAGGE
jgi:hypothetical protein